MNKFIQLLAALDDVYGEYVYRSHSRVSRIGNFFDDETDEHVVLLEYRIKVEVPEEALEDQRKQQERDKQFQENRASRKQYLEGLLDSVWRRPEDRQ